MSSSLFASLVPLRGTLLDGTGGPRRDAFIEIADGRIVGIGDAAGYEHEEADEIVDATGLWIVPGYVDAHAHLFDTGSLYTSPDDYDLTGLVPHEKERRRIVRDLEETLERFPCSGVTALASLGGPRWELDAARRSHAPRVVSAGPLFALESVESFAEVERVLVSGRTIPGSK